MAKKFLLHSLMHFWQFMLQPSDLIMFNTG